MRAVHKLRQHFFREEGSKIEEKVMTDMYRIVLRLRGVSKIAKKVLTYFMDGPLEFF